jgi:putative transposase
MARKARATLNSNLLKITQASETTLFRNDGDRDFFLARLAQLQRRYNFKVLAFCCGEANGFEVVLDTQGANIAKLMQSLTIAYAMHRKSPQKLFQQRYKSVALHSDAEVQAAIADLINTPHYSGCCFKRDQGIEFDWISVAPQRFYPAHSQRPRLDVEQARSVLSRWMKAHACDPLTFQHDKAKRNQCLLDFRTQHDVPLKTLAEVFELSESSVSKILKNLELGT